MTLHASDAARTIGVGSTAAQMHITDGELGMVTASGGLTVGSPTNGNITVDGVTEASSDQLGMVVLEATAAGQSVTFNSNPSSFDKGITVKAASGIVLSDSVVTKSSTTVLSAGIGSLTVAGGKSLDSTGQTLLITANDVDLVGSLDAGS